VVLGGDAKAQFEALTMRLCRERLPPEKAEATLTKLERKAGKDWKNVAWWAGGGPVRCGSWAAASLAGRASWRAALARGGVGVEIGRSSAPTTEERREGNALVLHLDLVGCVHRCA
jgi:hypothetical protein